MATLKIGSKVKFKITARGSNRELSGKVAGFDAAAKRVLVDVTEGDSTRQYKPRETAIIA